MTSTVSIIVPTYNQNPAYLRAALLSAKMQTHPCQIVVVDDGSKPAQEEIVDAVLAKSNGQWCDNYRYHWQPNGGVASALNKALELSTGDYVTWLPSDDLFKPEKTAIQLAAMQERDMAVSFCAWEEGIPQPVNTWPAAQYATREHLFAMLCQHSFINAATVMWRRDVFDTVGTWDERFRHCQDYHMLLKCASKFSFLAVNEVLVRRRLHPGQMVNLLKGDKEADGKRREIEILKEEFGVTAGVWIPK